MSRITAGERISGKKKAKRKQTKNLSEFRALLTESLSTLKTKMPVWKEQGLLFWQRLPMPHRIGLMTASAVLLLLLFLPWGNDEVMPSAEHVTESASSGERKSVPIGNLSSNETDETRTKSVAKNTDVQSNKGPVAEKPNRPVKASGAIAHAIKDGDTLSNIFRRYDLSLPDLYAMIKVQGKGEPLSQIKPGQELRMQSDDQGRVVQMKVVALSGDSVTFKRQADGSFRRL
ncbi:hypothetical protein CS022_10200 [Veronia nyctiphanis]|uniref:LysM domain-containing protein n=1 Tax=Veronia nyctiphanis TaxID=1278244 RepID=A0A4Q0YQF2_9GAMM|nr:LysM-like peptidoglycan-binding domain-containing protein [Veronia nyctiphanis]RXJ73340.1 hypothetical protein CS022_10200 [Veronia nyctiphanis]